LKVRVEDADALVDMFQRGADGTGLVVQELAAFQPFEADDVGHVGLQHHGAALGGAVFADLHPPVARHLHVEHDMAVAVALAAAVGPDGGAFPGGQLDVARAADAIHIAVEGQAGVQLALHIGHVHPEARVAHHEDVLRVEEREAFLDGLDGAGEVLARGLGGAGRLAQLGVRGIQEVKRVFEVAGAFADLVFQHGGALELGIGGT
jgi:hypothetical protein